MRKVIHRGLWLTAGGIFSLLGIIGLLMPIVPQMPFILLAAVCFMRGSERFAGWIEKKPWFIRLHTRFRTLRRR